MDTIIGVVAEQQRITPAEIPRHVARVRSAIIDRIKRVMKQVAEEQEPQTTRQAAPVAPPRVTDSLFNADVMNAFTICQAPPLVRAQDIMDTRIDEEVEPWLEDQSVLEARDGRPESVLQYWKRQYEMKRYRFLPLVAKIVFAVPSLSAQIERDFGNSGQTVTALRSSTSSHNIDMCSFLSQNRRFVNVCQCPELQHHEVSAHIPSNVTINLDPETEGRVDWGTITQECFSLSLSDTEGGA